MVLRRAGEVRGDAALVLGLWQRRQDVHRQELRRARYAHIYLCQPCSAPSPSGYSHPPFRSLTKIHTTNRAQIRGGDHLQQLHHHRRRRRRDRADGRVHGAPGREPAEAEVHPPRAGGAAGGAIASGFPARPHSPRGGLSEQLLRKQWNNHRCRRLRGTCLIPLSALERVVV